MWDDPLTDDQIRRIRNLKRAYWAQKGIGKEYLYCAYKPEPITRMKNLVEMRFVSRYALGPRVLDAGTGTGRFVMPLQQDGLQVIALDISVEMLRVGMNRAAKSGVSLRALAGDIERLPFADGAFDTLVSVTVLRHFPEWRRIFPEYMRVVRPGGRIIFDMASGDQRAYMKTHGLIEEDPDPFFDAVAYDAGLTMKEIEALAVEHGLAIVAVTPHDFFNENALLDRLLGDEKTAFLDRLRGLLEDDAAVGLYELMSRTLLPMLSPAVAGHLFIVLEKRPAPPHRPPYRTRKAPLPADTPDEQFMGILNALLGPRFDEYLQQARPYLAHPGGQRLLAFLRQELLPRFPLETLIWEVD